MATGNLRSGGSEPELHETLARPLAELFVGVVLLLVLVTAIALADPPRRIDLYCHRTASEDVPENTLESLQQAALLGCDSVEVDLRRTLDGVLILNHDGFLERLTDGTGEVEKSYFAELQVRDFGAWMSPRFEGLKVATFEDALRVARKLHIRLILDIKTPGLVPEIASTVRKEQMWDRVRWPADSDEVKRLLPKAYTGADESWVQPGISAEEVKRLQREHKRVVVNFSANGHELDVGAMEAAVRAGVDGINVDFPRVGAEAVGRPVERRLSSLIAAANAGSTGSRSKAILTLAKYQGFPLARCFTQWLLDPDEQVSRAAAVALVLSRPRVDDDIVIPALRASNAATRANGAWALGQIRAPAADVTPLLRDSDSRVLSAALVALSRMPGAVDSTRLVELLQHGDITVRGPAALALAAHAPGETFAATISAQLNAEVKLARAHYDRWAAQGKPKLSEAEIAVIVGYYRCEMKLVQALAMLHGPTATSALEAEAFRSDLDFSQMNGVVSAFQLWDRIAADPAPAIAALAADSPAANRAEWMLIQAGPDVLPAIHSALKTAGPNVRARLLEIQRQLTAVSP